MTQKNNIKNLAEWIQNNESNIWVESVLFYENTVECDIIPSIMPHYGGNEGIYLDIYLDIPDYPKRHLITCKTLDASRDKMLKCFESAGRIYNYMWDMWDKEVV